MKHQDIEVQRDQLHLRTLISVEDTAFLRLGYYPDKVAMPLELAKQIMQAGAEVFKEADRPYLREARRMRQKNNQARLLRRGQ